MSNQMSNTGDNQSSAQRGQGQHCSGSGPPPSQAAAAAPNSNWTVATLRGQQAQQQQQRQPPLNNVSQQDHDLESFRDILTREFLQNPPSRRQQRRNASLQAFLNLASRAYLNHRGNQQRQQLCTYQVVPQPFQAQLQEMAERKHAADHGNGDLAVDGTLIGVFDDAMRLHFYFRGSNQGESISLGSPEIRRYMIHENRSPRMNARR